jgi:hypothetical protein
MVQKNKKQKTYHIATAGCSHFQFNESNYEFSSVQASCGRMCPVQFSSVGNCGACHRLTVDAAVIVIVVLVTVDAVVLVTDR